jgi:predicted AAA+ superfamily ATPase
MIFERTIESLAHEVATTFRAMIVCGPRQVGKTWLLRKLTSRLGGYGQVSFDKDSLCA